MHACPYCTSTLTTTKRAAFLAGTAATQAHTVGVGATGHGLGAGVASTVGTSQSGIAALCAPPEPSTVSAVAVFVVVFVATFIGCGVLMDTRALYWFEIAVAIAGLFSVAAAYDNGKNRAANVSRVAQWEREWFCGTCAKPFEPAA